MTRPLTDPVYRWGVYGVPVSTLRAAERRENEERRAQGRPRYVTVTHRTDPDLVTAALAANIPIRFVA